MEFQERICFLPAEAGISFVNAEKPATQDSRYRGNDEYTEKQSLHSLVQRLNAAQCDTASGKLPHKNRARQNGYGHVLGHIVQSVHTVQDIDLNAVLAQAFGIVLGQARCLLPVVIGR